MMSGKAYIIDFFEPGEVADAYTHYFKHYAWLLSTDDELRLNAQVRIRFNFPNGHGTTIVARVVSTMQAEGYGMQIPDNATTTWLLDTAKTYAEKMERVRGQRKATAAPAPEPAPKPSAPVQETPQPAGIEEDRPATRPIHSTPPIREVPAQPVPVAQEPTPRPAPKADPVSDMADAISPSEAELRKRVAELDEIVAQAGATKGETVQAAPPPASRPPQVEKSPPVAATAPEADVAPAAAPPEPEEPQQDLAEQIAGLTDKQKKKLAISGGIDERRILMADEDTSLHLWVFKNPALTEAEVIDYASNPELAPDALNFLLQNRRWGTTPGVTYELVLNPSTPPEAIPNLLTVLPRKTLESLAERSGVRHLVARQAKRLLLERSQ